MNNKYSGNVSDYQPVAEDASRVIISYGLNQTEGEMAEWFEIHFYKKNGRPTFEQAKAAIIADINEKVKDKIIGGFVWNDKPVWFSEENQLNFSQSVVPVTLKIGEEEDGTPIYHQFDTVEDLKAFSDACNAWKQQCLTAGYAEKDSIDWAPYEDYFKTEE
jgi:hypothetical protein